MERCLYIAGSASDVPEAWPRNAGEYPLSSCHKSTSIALENSQGILRGSAWDGADGGTLLPLVLCCPPLLWNVEQAVVWVQ